MQSTVMLGHTMHREVQDHKSQTSGNALLSIPNLSTTDAAVHPKLPQTKCPEN